MPLVSLGMPVRNGERYIARSLQSILAQEFGDFELIISDNASTDGTREICERFAREDSRIAYRRFERNRGASENFNRVFELSGGTYFKWAAADDLLAPAHLSRCVETFRSAPPEVVLVYPKTVLIDGEGKRLGPYEDGMDLRFPSPSRRLRHVVQHLDMSNPVFGLLRSSALSRTRLIGPYIASDRVLLADLAMLGQFWEVPAELFLRRIHAGMYLRANPTPQQRAAWFDPRNTGAGLPMCRLFVEHVREVRRLPLPSGEKVRCYAIFVEEWTRRGRVVGAELLGALMALVGLRKGPGQGGGAAGD
ncbi:MAG: glycosyltransferase family 2 protein [Planctomycetota bacterium]